MLPPLAMGTLALAAALTTTVACGGDDEAGSEGQDAAAPRGPVAPDRLVTPSPGRSLVGALPAPGPAAPPLPATPLTSPWAMSVVGPGTASQALDPTVTASGRVFALSAAGQGLELAGVEDEFLFVHRLLSGDGAVVALVRSLEGCDSGRVSFGPMIRASTASGAAYVLAALSGQKGVALQARANGDIYASTLRLETQVSPPVWLKVERQADRVRAGFSQDGQQWTDAMSFVHDFGQDVEVGIAASSHRGVPCRALVESVEVLGTR